MEITDKVASVMRMFGLDAERLGGYQNCYCCELEIETGDVVYITGPSGAGKSVLLKELENRIGADKSINLSDIVLAEDKAVIDCFEGDFLTSLRLLSVAGLNDVFCVLNRPAYLSEGQKWRFRLAMAIASGKKFIFADEFCANLDRITASVIAYNVAKFAKRNGVTFLLASSHEDILADLSPDVLVVKEWDSKAKVVYKEVKTQTDRRSV